jgi:peptidoglycan hydrolase-like protein with peptidoglycan-binding domain
VLPDQIWVARWDGKANTTTSYLRPDGWHPHARVKQYQGGHDETWGGVTINIDRNFLDVGLGSVPVPESHCGGVKIGYGLYPALKPATDTVKPPPAKVKALQCLLQEQGRYAGKVNGLYTTRTIKAANSWQATAKFTVSTTWSRRNWMSLLSAGDRPVAKYGSVGPAVRRVQRTLNAVTDRDVPIKATGVFDAATTTALKYWQRYVGLPMTGVAGNQTWAAFATGRTRR